MPIKGLRWCPGESADRIVLGKCQLYGWVEYDIVVILPSAEVVPCITHVAYRTVGLSGWFCARCFRVKSSLQFRPMPRREIHVRWPRPAKRMRGHDRIVRSLNWAVPGVRACYDEGKRVGETLCFDFHRQHNIPVRVARIFNTFGPGMHPYGEACGTQFGNTRY